MADIPEVLFVCTHNAGRSQMAAALPGQVGFVDDAAGPLVAGLVQQFALGAPLVVAGVVKAGYDVTLWAGHITWAGSPAPAHTGLAPLRVPP